MNLGANTESLKVLLKLAVLPEIRFHDLRQTAVFLMFNNGVDVLVVSRRLGHSKPSITLDVYGHLTSSTQQKVAGLMDNLRFIEKVMILEVKQV